MFSLKKFDLQIVQLVTLCYEGIRPIGEISLHGTTLLAMTVIIDYIIIVYT